MWRPKKPLNVTLVSIINSCKGEIRLAADYIVNETLAREGLNPVRTKHPLPPAASLWQREARARVERKRVGDNGKGERGSEAPAFLLFSPSNARLLFYYYYCCFHWNTQREPLQRRKNKTCSFLLLKYPLSCYNCLCYSNPLSAECMGLSRWLKEPRCQYVHNSEKSVAIKILVLLQP